MTEQRHRGPRNGYSQFGPMAVGPCGVQVHESQNGGKGQYCFGIEHARVNKLEHFADSTGRRKFARRSDGRLTDRNNKMMTNITVRGLSVLRRSMYTHNQSKSTERRWHH